MNHSGISAAGLLPGLPVAIPLGVAAIMAATRSWLKRWQADSLGILGAAIALVVNLLLLARALHGSFIYWFGNWYPRGSMAVGISFLVEPIGASLASLAALLIFLALLFSWRYVDSGSNHYQPLMLIFLAAMSGFALTADIFNLFVFFELMSTAAFALCGLKTAEPAPLQGSFNFAVTNTIAAFLVLTGIGLLYAITGALNMAQIGAAIGPRHDPLVLFAFTLLTCGFLIKGAIVPFHFWLPDAHAVAPTPFCVIFSGVMVELGIFAVVRLHSVVFGQTFATHEIALRSILMAFAGTTALFGGVMCYAEHHLKRLLAFSTISHAGLMLLCFAIGGPSAIAAMFVYLLAHALLKSSLFFTSGILLHRLRSISERTLFGKGRGFWWTAALWFLGGTGLAAAPPFATYLGEAGAAHAGDIAHVPAVSWIFLFAGTITGAAVFRVGMRVFFGWGDDPITDQAAEVGELPETDAKVRIEWYHFAPPALCIAGAMSLGLWHGWLPELRDAAASMSNQAAYVHTVYTGQPVSVRAPGWNSALLAAAWRGLAGAVLALMLALTSVFRSTFARGFRAGAFLEHGIPGFRELQSGHPGDYVTWITAGLAAFGTAVVSLLRS